MLHNGLYCRRFILISYIWYGGGFSSIRLFVWIRVASAFMLCNVKDRNFLHICHQDLCFQCKEEHVIHLATLHNTWKIYRGNTQTLFSQRSALGFEVDITTDTVILVKSLCVKLVLNIYPRWQRCVSNVNAAFGYASSALYVQDYFAKESKSKVGNTEQTSSLFPKKKPVLAGLFFFLIFFLKLFLCSYTRAQFLLLPKRIHVNLS